MVVKPTSVQPSGDEMPYMDTLFVCVMHLQQIYFFYYKMASSRTRHEPTEIVCCLTGRGFGRAPLLVSDPLILSDLSCSGRGVVSSGHPHYRLHGSSLTDTLSCAGDDAR